MTRLGVNVDHIATVRQARRESFPDPTEAALAAVQAGADGITAHLREDRRHIQNRDIEQLKNLLPVPLNMEMAATPELVSIACRIKPAWTCLVPEKRTELTTEGGLNVAALKGTLREAIAQLSGEGIKVSLFIEPNAETARLSKELGAHAVEFHTGGYARAFETASRGRNEIEKIRAAAQIARQAGLLVNAGHGLNYENVEPLAHAFSFDEFNIGFAIVARALFVGMESAVVEMKRRMTVPCAAS